MRTLGERLTDSVPRELQILSPTHTFANRLRSGARSHKVYNSPMHYCNNNHQHNVIPVLSPDLEQRGDSRIWVDTSVFLAFKMLKLAISPRSGEHFQLFFSNLARSAENLALLKQFGEIWEIFSTFLAIFAAVRRRADFLAILPKP